MADINLWIAALEIGCFFALIGLTLYLVVVGADFFNFATGPYAMAAALFAGFATASWGMSIYVAVLVGILIGIVSGMLTEIVVVKPIQKRAGGAELPALVVVTATLFGLQQLAGTLFGRTPRSVEQFLPLGDLTIGDVVIDRGSLSIILTTVVIFVGVIAWLNMSTVGQLLRAVGDNNEAARMIGINVNVVRLWAFGIAGAIAAIAGLVFAAKSGVQFTSGLSWTLTGFLALVIGGLGRPWAPLIGGLALGFIQVFSSYYYGATGASIAIFLVALVFFAVRPEGLFQRKVRV